MATIRENLRRFNMDLEDSLGLIRRVNSKDPVVRFTTNEVDKLNEELNSGRLTSNEE